MVEGRCYYFCSIFIHCIHIQSVWRLHLMRAACTFPVPTYIMYLPTTSKISKIHDTKSYTYSPQPTHTHSIRSSNILCVALLLVSDCMIFIDLCSLVMDYYLLLCVVPMEGNERAHSLIIIIRLPNVLDESNQTQHSNKFICSL